MDPIDRQDDQAILNAEDAPAPEPALGDYGPNNEKLPPNLQEALRNLAVTLMDEDASARREYLKRVKKCHQYYRGEQFVYWDDRRELWLAPTTHQLVNAGQRFRYTTNIVRPYGLTLIAALSQSIPKTRFWPQSPQQEEDVNTADAASAMAEHIQRTNRIDRLQVEESSLLCLDGMAAGYVRWVNDADRFGTKTVPTLGAADQEMAPAGFECPECATRMDAPGQCPTCGYSVDETHAAPPITATIPQETATEEIPNGQVVIEMLGALNVKIPATARDLRDFGYLAQVMEVPASKVKTVHPHVAEKIGKGDSLGAMNDSTERTDRLSLVSGRRGGGVMGADPSQSLVTYHRIWLRQWTFVGVKDPKERKALEALFPTGVRVCFADDTYCEATEEKMDDHWRIMHASPGDGQYRDPLLWDLLSIQDRLNTLKNLGMETYQHGIPLLVMDRNVLKPSAWANSGSLPGSAIGANGRAGQPLSNAFYETAPTQVSRQAVEEGRTLMSEDSQFTTGAFPALFGGGAINTETASGYAMQRDQAMGRLGMVFRQQREFHAELLTIGVEEMKRNMPEHGSTEIALLGDSGQFSTKIITLENLQGAYHAYPEADENFPESFSQRKDGLLRLVEANSALIQPAFESPSALRQMWRGVGITDFKLPGEIARQRQYQEIQQCLREQAPPAGPSTLDPMTGQPVPPPPTSSVPIDVEFDNHGVHWATGQEWMESDDAAAQKVNNPAGYLNARGHLLMHKAVMDQQAAQQAMQAAAAAAPPPEAPPPPPQGGTASTPHPVDEPPAQ